MLLLITPRFVSTFLLHITKRNILYTFPSGFLQGKRVSSHYKLGLDVNASATFQHPAASGQLSNAVPGLGCALDGVLFFRSLSLSLSITNDQNL